MSEQPVYIDYLVLANEIHYTLLAFKVINGRFEYEN